MKTICPFCGAYSPRSCDFEEETDGMCPWVESGQWEDDFLADMEDSDDED